MVAPFGKLTLAVKSLTTPPPTGTKVHFETINDFGAGVNHTGKVQ